MSFEPPTNTIYFVPKYKKKRNYKTRKKSSNKRIGFIGILAIIIIIAFSFSSGIMLGLTRNFSFVKHQEASKLSSIPDIMRDYVLPTADVKVPILVYHYVEFVKDPGDTIRKSLDIIPPIFEKQIRTLQHAGYNFIMSSDLGLYLDGKKQLPEKPIILTFDDGYEDFYTDVFPILKKYNVKVTAYIISGVLGRKNYMTASQLREIASSGLVEIGAHSVHHPNLKSVSKEVALEEIIKSKEMLENELGTRIVSFAYPYGGYNAETVDIVKKAGYTNAVGTHGGLIVNQSNRFVLFRIHPGVATGASLLKVL